MNNIQDHVNEIEIIVSTKIFPLYVVKYTLDVDI